MSKTANEEEKEPTCIVLFKWTLARTDPTPYKVYGEELEPIDTFVEVEVPMSEVRDRKGETSVTLTPRGMALAMSKIARAINLVYTGDDES
jgi:hypothetical protein